MRHSFPFSMGDILLSLLLLLLIDSTGICIVLFYVSIDSIDLDLFGLLEV